MRITLVRGLMRQLDWRGHCNDRVAVGHCSKRLAKAVFALPLPVKLQQLLCFEWIKLPATLYPPGHDLKPVKGILTDVSLKTLLPAKMLPIGATGNGDILVLRWAGDNVEVGFVCFDEFGGDKPVPANCYSRIVPTLEEYLLRAHDKLYLPYDSYSAYEYNDLREQIARELAAGIDPSRKRVRRRRSRSV